MKKEYCHCYFLLFFVKVKVHSFPKFFWQSYVSIVPPTQPSFVLPVVQPCSKRQCDWRRWCGGPSSLKQQDEQREQKQEATETSLTHGGTCDSVIVWRVGVQSRSAARTLTTHAHPTSWPADVVTWGKSSEWDEGKLLKRRTWAFSSTDPESPPLLSL